MGVMDKRKAWQNKLNEGRWAAILWPEEWGGRAATTAQQVIYTQVMAKYRSPGIFNANGIVQIGPSIIAWGTEDQKARWLPGILDATRALVPGLLGTAGRLRPREPAHHRDPLRRRLALRRERAEDLDLAPRRSRSGACSSCAPIRPRSRAAASTKASPRSSSTWSCPGIDIRPIREITGDSLFCEVFFTDVKIPVGDRLGDEGNGWLVSMGALGQERVGSAGQAISMAQDLRTLLQTAKAENPDALRDPAIRERVARAAHADRRTRGC